MTTQSSEFDLWAKTCPEQRSFLVEVLHWFHYRPAALKKSWAREEVLTWELLRALEILPQQYFTHPLVQKISSLGRLAHDSATPLLGLERIVVTRYPTLGLLGGKRNCKSDIGLGNAEFPTIWIEAKTAKFKPEDLREQLHQQATAMKDLYPQAQTVLVTLVPKSRSLEEFPNISWDDVASVMVSGINLLEESGLPFDIAYGYRTIARELIDRIETHPNRVDGWV
jgi:hypothetical protein